MLRREQLQKDNLAKRLAARRGSSSVSGISSLEKRTLKDIPLRRSNRDE